MGGLLEKKKKNNLFDSSPVVHDTFKINDTLKAKKLLVFFLVRGFDLSEMFGNYRHPIKHIEKW